MSDQTEKDILTELKEIKQTTNRLFLEMQKVNDNLRILLQQPLQPVSPQPQKP